MKEGAFKCVTFSNTPNNLNLTTTLLAKFSFFFKHTNDVYHLNVITKIKRDFDYQLILYHNNIPEHRYNCKQMVQSDFDNYVN